MYEVFEVKKNRGWGVRIKFKKAISTDLTAPKRRGVTR